MIKEYEFYHGVIFTKLIHFSTSKVSLRRYDTSGNASYVLNEKIGIYIKHSTKRITPWRFSFSKIHQDEILDMKNKLGKVFLVLVCGDDGIVTISFDDLKLLLNDTHGGVEWISAARNRNKEYTVNGSDGSLVRKVGKSDFPKRILEP